MPRYDLHTHSSFSDGTLSPRDLVARAHQQGVDVLALTDHDVTDGIDEATQAAKEWGLKLVPGVEVSVSVEGLTLHVVGLGVDPENKALAEGLAGLREFRLWRGEEIGKRLEKRGVVGALDGANAWVSGPILSRTHFARFLVDAGYVRTIPQAFKKYLAKGCPGYVRGEWASLTQALDWIHLAGGQAILAHPLRYKLGRGRFRRMLSEFKDLGGDGIEVFSGSQSQEGTSRLADLCGEFELLASVGSDFHGPEQSWLELGRLPELPVSCTPVWQRWVI
ncbi:MAG: PHP domain-containing protein [Gammaproteobacteria bacterium]|nr:PHP domain-containing protein [Gammaproteobacteria bacterium]